MKSTDFDSYVKRSIVMDEKLSERDLLIQLHGRFSALEAKADMAFENSEKRFKVLEASSEKHDRVLNRVQGAGIALGSVVGFIGWAVTTLKLPEWGSK